MANSRSARKRIRANERKHERNRAVRSAVRTRITKARRAILGVDERLDSAEQLQGALSALDRAAEKGILHRNNVARRKSRLMALANRLAAAATGGEQAAAEARAAAVGGEKGRKAIAGRARTATKATAAKATGAKAAPAAARSATTKPAAAKPAAAKATATPATPRAKKSS